MIRGRGKCWIGATQLPVPGVVLLQSNSQVIKARFGTSEVRFLWCLSHVGEWN